MGILMKLALLFSILGFAQVYSYEAKYEDVEIRNYEVKCHQMLETLYQNINQTLSLFKEVSEIKQHGGEYIRQILELIEKHGCEKESADKKGVEELITKLQAGKSLLEKYIKEYSVKYLGALDSITLYSTWALEEMHCCCSKVNICLKKYEYPVGKLIKNVKECKQNKCNKAINTLLSALSNTAYPVKQATTEWELRNQIKLMEELCKLKDEYIKDVKCANEKVTSAMGEMLQNLQLRSSSLNYSEYEMLILDKGVLQRMEEVMKERKGCKYEHKKQK